MKHVHAETAPVSLPASRRAANIGDYVALTKPRLNFLVVLTSAAVLNQVYERDTDARMRRTRSRPLPDGRVGATEAGIFGAVLAGCGLAVLAVSANMAAALLALATLVIYLVVYTPMKRRSPAATLVGAVPGALPPLIGWAAAHGGASLGGWTLFGIVFLWQIPHFMAIAWLYRDDYKSAGFPMLPVVEPSGRRTGQHAVLYAAALVPVSLTPSFVGISGTIYFWVALALGLALLGLAAAFAAGRSERAARWLFFGSITYLPLLWAAMVFDH
jgi:protoheme IX farnesyltransferase